MNASIAIGSAVITVIEDSAVTVRVQTDSGRVVIVKVTPGGLIEDVRVGDVYTSEALKRSCERTKTVFSIRSERARNRASRSSGQDNGSGNSAANH